MTVYVADFDDFHEENHNLDLLHALHDRVPGYKVTLFCPVGLCSVSWIECVREPWIQFGLHGNLHWPGNECVDWNRRRAEDYLDSIESGWHWSQAKVFKAPGWQPSRELLDVLGERGYILVHNRPVEYAGPSFICFHRSITLSPPIRNTVVEVKAAKCEVTYIHGHIQNICRNGLEECFETFASYQGEYKFFTELWQGKE